MNYDKVLEMDNVTKGDCEDGYANNKRSVIISDGHILDFLDKDEKEIDYWKGKGILC